MKDDLQDKLDAAFAPVKATVISKTLGHWGFHADSVNNDVDIEVEFNDGHGLTTRQCIIVYHSVDLDGFETDLETNIPGAGKTKHAEKAGKTFADAAAQFVAEIGPRVDEAIAAVIAAMGAEPSDVPVPELALRPAP